MGVVPAPRGGFADVTRRSALIVDDEDTLLKVIVKGLEVLQPSLVVYSARSVGEAIAQLASRSFDLVITDLVMPEMDGFELLAYLSRSARRIPIIVMSAFLTTARRGRVASLGGLWCFEKPVHLQTLSDAITEILASGPDSIVHGVSVAGLLQLLEIEKKTSTMTVHQGETVGRLFLHRGRLVDAECGELRGVDAAQRLVGLTDAKLELANVLASNRRTIDQSVSTLLLDAFRLADEAHLASRIEEDGPAPPYDGLNAAAVTGELEKLVAITGFVAAAIYSPQMGVLARQGDPGTVDNELCALVNASTGGLGEVLAEREWGTVKDADIVTSRGWLVCFRSVPDCGGISLVTTFRNASSLGLLQHRLREIIGHLRRLCLPS